MAGAPPRGRWWCSSAATAPGRESAPAEPITCSTACRAYAGEYPLDWEYPGRAGIVFASERDVHEGCLLAYGVPRLPREVRAPTEREPVAEPREIL